MFTQSFIARSGQSMKLFPGLTLVAVGGLLFLTALVGPQQDQRQALTMILFAAAVTVIGLCVPLVLVRCPRCRSRIVWRAMRQRSPNEWLTWLMSLVVCPDCGFRPDELDR